MPVIVTWSLLRLGHYSGLTDVTVGTGSKVKWSADHVGDVPIGVVTVTSTVPVPVGDVAVIWLG